jgi:hypothetical protein
MRMDMMIGRHGNTYISQSIDQVHFIPQKTLIHTIHLFTIYTAKTHEHPTYKNPASLHHLSKNQEVQLKTKKKKSPVFTPSSLASPALVPAISPGSPSPPVPLLPLLPLLPPAGSSGPVAAAAAATVRAAGL